MSRYNKFYYNTRYVLPIMIGIIVGFALSLLCTTFFECDDFIEDEKIRLELIEQQKQADEFEPRINLQGKPKKPSKTPQKLIRPRYASVELNIRYKLFIGVISTSRMLTNFSIFLNQSFTQVSKKVQFFVNNADMNEKTLLETTPPGVNVVNFNDDRDYLLPFHSLKYVIDNYIDNYDWFFFVTDNTFVRSHKLLDLVNHISISQDLYMGNIINPKESIYCSLSSGIIFSNTLLRKILPQMEWCTKNSYSEDATDNIGRCVLHSANLACTDHANGKNASFHYNPTFDFDSSIDHLMYTEKFNQSITVNRIKDIQTMMKLQIYFNAVEMDEINAEIDSLEKNIMETACDTPEGCDSLIWPLGVPPPYKPTSRHEVIRHDYFNLTHLFLGTDFDVINELTDDYKEDIKELIAFSIENLNKKIPNRYQMRDLLNGYKQFDPTRGASYILDLILEDTVQEILIHKRVNLMRPLGLVEIMPMPYVTESSKINLIITFTAENTKLDVLRFFESYEDFVLQIKEIADKINLFVVYLSSNNLISNEKELFSYINDQIKEYTKKYSSLVKTSSRIIEAKVEISNITMYYSEGYRQLNVIEKIGQNISSDGLILMALPCIEMKSEFLNRVRLNTIKSNQVFLPIPFNEFMPQIVYPSNMTYLPSEVEINKNIGYFNTYTYEFISFYNSDYKATRKNFIFNNKILKPENKSKLNTINLADYAEDLYELFKSNTDLHILRATDQALKCRWHLIDNCDKPKKSESERNRCLKQRENGLGTKAQLAMFLMKNYDLISKN